MKKILFALMFPTRILLFHGGQVLLRHGGNFALPMIGGWEDLCGPVLTIAANQRPFNGRISIPILVSWICAVFLKIFITTINHGGRTKMCCTFHRTGTGKEKKGNLLMYG